MLNDILENNLHNIRNDTDLFGEKIDKLSMKDRIGFLPTSIWEPDWTKTKYLKNIIGDDASLRTEISNDELGRKTTYGFMNHASIFNPNLAQMILSAYCPKEAMIYDPFAGGGTRGIISSAMGHAYFGLELREDEVKRIEKKKISLGKDFGIKCGDATECHVREEMFDFSFTCPPYYNLEIYSNDTRDLSNLPTYDCFIDKLKAVLYWTFYSLKKGCLAVWVVGNFRDKHGNLISFNGDVIRLAMSIGFKFHDEIIFNGASKSSVQRCGQFEANRKSVRIHEYILIFKK